MEFVRDAIIKGFKLGKGLLKAVYDLTDYFYDCEDVFTKSVSILSIQVFPH